MSTIINGAPWRLQPDNASQSAVLGAWTNETTNILNRGMYASPEIVTRSRVYLFGGWMAGQNCIITAPIDASGVIGEWADHGATLPVDKTGMQAVLTKNRVYLIGGNSTSIYTAPIDSSTGLLGTISSAGVSTPWLSQNIEACLVTKNHIYIFRSGSDSYAFIGLDADGVILGTSWTTSYQDAIRHNAAFAYVVNRTGTYDRIYRIGGWYSPTMYPYISYAGVDNTSGALTGSWSQLGSTQLVTAVNMMRSVVTQDRLFVIGGNISGTPQTVVQSCPIYSDATLGSFELHTNSLAVAVSDPAIIVTSTRVYALGGVDGSLSKTVQYATFAGGENDYLADSFINEDDEEATGDFDIPPLSMAGYAQAVSPWESVGRVDLYQLSISGFAGCFFEAGAPHDYKQTGIVSVNGVAETQWYADGDYRFPGISVRGKGPTAGDFSLPAMSISGVAVSPHVATGSFVSGKLAVSGEAEYKQRVAASGAFLLSRLVIGGSGEAQRVMSGEYTFPAIRIGGEATLLESAQSSGYSIPRFRIGGRTEWDAEDIDALEFYRDAAVAPVSPSTWDGQALHFTRQ